MRVPIQRFESLRLIGKSRYSNSVEVAGGEPEVDEHGRVMPPAPRIGGHLGRRRSRHPEFTQLGVNLGAGFPLLETERTQTLR